MSSVHTSDTASELGTLNINDKPRPHVKPQLKGTVDSRFDGIVTHFRGIPYASISKRFAKPQPTTSFPEDTADYTIFGPRCPQPQFDIRDFMRIPKSIPKDEDQAEDELKCTNLNVTCPTSSSATSLPVLLWIHGGSLMLPYPNAQHRLGDAGPLVAQSIELGKPIILVTINYRLNIFHFGTGESEVNLAIQDQKAALEWVKAHISKFGGDPDNITVGGESAGAIFVHGLLASGALFERAIMQSGSLYTSPPQPDKAGLGLIGLIEGNLQLLEFDKGNQSGSFGPEATVAETDVKTLIQTLKDLQINRLWLWDEPCFKDWDNDKRVLGKLKGLLIGDTKHEWVLWQGAFVNLTAKKIRACFETKTGGPEPGQKLAKAYGVDKLDEDHDSARREALHFLGDAVFSAWPPSMAKAISGKAYQYYYDEGNPFAPAHDAKAQHAVDLFALFGGYDDDVNDETRRVGRMLRTKWIDFVNGEEPWHADAVYLFGPHGMTGEVDRDSHAAVHDLNPRRRQARFAVMHEVGWQAVHEVWQALMSAAASSLS